MTTEALVMDSAGDDGEPDGERKRVESWVVEGERGELVREARASSQSMADWEEEEKILAAEPEWRA